MSLTQGQKYGHSMRIEITINNLPAKLASPCNFVALPVPSQKM